MPYLKGRKVSNEEWVAAKGGQPVNWKEATGYNDGSEAAPLPSDEEATVSEAPAPVQKRRSRNKKAAAEAAIAAATGQDVDLDAEEELPEVDVTNVSEDE